jgi:AcrR family transcriptional regulator
MSTSKQRALVPRKRQERGARRIEAIVAAAAELFAARGIDGTSMNAIAKASGLGIGSLYQYFPSRDAIVDAVAERFVRDWDEHKQAVLASLQPMPLRDLLHRAVVDLFDYYARQAGLKAMLDADPRRAASIRAVHEEVGIFVPVFAQYYPDVPYDAVARATYIAGTIARGAAAMLATGDHDADRASFVDDIVCACYGYVVARLGEPRT